MACGPGSPSCRQNTVAWPAVLSVLGTLVSLWPQDSSPVRWEQPEGGPSSPRGGHLAFSLLPALLSCFGLHPASPSDVMVFSLSSRPGGPLVTLTCAWGPAACLQTAFSIPSFFPGLNGLGAFISLAGRTRPGVLMFWLLYFDP